MRIDKFLKVSRVIKRRTVAAEACSGGRIEINGKPAKPAKEVKPGDTVTVSFGSNSLTFEVLNTDEKQTKQSAAEMYSALVVDAHVRISTLRLPTRALSRSASK